MASTASTPPPLPSDRTIALALAVVKSKPKDLTVREYIETLRQHIVTRRRQDVQVSSHRHIDAAKYWRSQYQRLESSLATAQSEAIDLKIEIERLKEQLKESRPKTGTRKRKQAEDVPEVERASKRGRRSTAVSAQPQASGSTDVEYDFSGLGTAGNELMRMFYQVNSISKSYQKTDPDLLAQRCIIAASVVPQVVREASQNDAEARNKTRYPLKDILTAVSKVVLCLVMGLNRVARVSEDAQGKVVYAYVHMFAQLLDILSEIATLQTRTVTTSAPTRVRDVMSLLTTFFCDMLNGLNPDMDAHKSLLEGYAYVVLKRVGTVLHISTFGHTRTDSIEGNISIGTEKRAANGTNGHLMTNEAQAATIEGPFLTRILQCVLTVAPAYMSEVGHPRTGKSKGSKSSKTLLSDETRKKLQSTLVVCMFGTDNGEEGSLLKNYLEMPVMANLDEVMPPARETHMPEWFAEEVWKLLGWEILVQAAP